MQLFKYASLLVTTFLLSISSVSAQDLYRTIDVIPLSENCDWAVAPDSTGVVFSTTDGGVADYLVGITTDAGFSSAVVSVCNADSIMQQSGDSGLALALPVALRRNNEIAFAMEVKLDPFADPPPGGNRSSYSSGSWLDDYSDWFNGTFGSGWSEAVGGCLHSVGSTFMDQETMANASDGAILTGTVAASIPLAVGIVCGGEVILGVGTVGGTVTAGGTATTGGIGTVIGTEIIDTTAEVIVEKATGVPVIIPCSIPDLVQDGGKLIVRRLGRAPEFPAGRLHEDAVLDRAIDYLGSGYRELSPGRYVSADGLRQFRYGAHEVRNPANHHTHFEALDEFGRVIENSVVEIFK